MKMIAVLALLGATAMARNADDKDAVSAAAGRLAESASYAFKGETKVESAFGDAGAQQIPVFDGKYSKESGTHITAGDRGEYFRKGDRILVKNPQGDWTDLDKAQFGGGGTPGGNRQRGVLASRIFLKNMRAPHEEAKDLAKGFKELKKEEKGEKVGERECAVYAGDLTEDAVKASPVGRMITQFGALGGGAQNAEMSGKGKIWIDSDGNLARYQLATRIAVDFQGTAIEFSMTRSTELSGVGKTKVEVPEAVQKLLDKPAEKPEDKKEN